MDNEQLLKSVKEKATMWLSEQYDEATRAEVKEMLESEDPTQLIESFYKDLEFGTGGLRGIMGAGTNRMNIYTVGAATQGLANYLKEAFPDMPQISVAVGHDVRNNSRKFAEIVANIFSANGIKAYLFDSFRPTPELSFAIRHFGCQSGVNITASHNPKEYNGYKAYWADGAQIIAPHDVNIINHVNRIKSVNDIKFQGNPDLIQIIGEDIQNILLPFNRFNRVFHDCLVVSGNPHESRALESDYRVRLIAPFLFCIEQDAVAYPQQISLISSVTSRFTTKFLSSIFWNPGTLRDNPASFPCSSPWKRPRNRLWKCRDNRRFRDEAHTRL